MPDESSQLVYINPPNQLSVMYLGSYNGWLEKLYRLPKAYRSGGEPEAFLVFPENPEEVVVSYEFEPGKVALSAVAGIVHV